MDINEFDRSEAATSFIFFLVPGSAKWWRGLWIKEHITGTLFSLNEWLSCDFRPADTSVASLRNKFLCEQLGFLVRNNQYIVFMSIQQSSGYFGRWSQKGSSSGTIVQRHPSSRLDRSGGPITRGHCVASDRPVAKSWNVTSHLAPNQTVKNYDWQLSLDGWELSIVTPPPEHNCTDTWWHHQKKVDTSLLGDIYWVVDWGSTEEMNTWTK